MSTDTFPLDLRVGCQHCGDVACVAAYVISAEAEDGGEPVHVGTRCLRTAVAFMSYTAIHRTGPVYIEGVTA
jgi:hypothetical protein